VACNLAVPGSSVEFNDITVPKLGWSVPLGDVRASNLAKAIYTSG